VEKFPEDRGLSLSPEKTKITHIKNGFTFLGQHFRKHGRTLHITPAKEGVISLKSKVHELIRKYVGFPLAGLVKKLNQTLRGWGNYHRHVVASEAFSQIDTYVFEELWRMIKRRHRSRSKKWLIHNYWNFTKRRWMFTVKGKNKKGPCICQVIRLSSFRTGISSTESQLRYNSRSVQQGPSLKCLSRMTRNCPVRFLGGDEAERPLTHPIFKN